MAGEIQIDSVTALTASGSNIVLNNVDTATNRTNLGLGSMATQNANAVALTGGSITGTTIVPTTPFSFRNRIINGNLSNPVNQRGAASITASTGYTYDRWYYDGSTYLYQGIEDKNVNNGTYVISWEGSGINAAWKVSTDTTANNGPDATTGFTSVSNGGTFTVNEGTEYSKHLWIRFDGTLANLNKVQVEEGTVVTPFEHRPISVELSLAQRYFEKSYDIDTAPGTSTQENSFRTIAPRTLSSATDYMYSIQYKVIKRSGTDLVIYSTDGTQGSVRDISGATNTTLRSSLGGASNLMTGFDIIDTRLYAFQWTAEAEL